MRQSKKSLQQHKDAVNKARRERAAAKRAALKTADMNTGTETMPHQDGGAQQQTKTIGGKKTKAVVKYMAARATDRGAVILQCLDHLANPNPAEIATELLQNGKVNLYDVIHILKCTEGNHAGVVESTIIILPSLLII